jgi:5-methylcytosine-specific restriction protein A
VCGFGYVRIRHSGKNGVSGLVKFNAVKHRLKKGEFMATYLLKWNPLLFPWEDLEECIKEVEDYGYFECAWSCGNTKKILPGDRLFLIRLGKEPRGIVASGWAVSKVLKRSHWNYNERKRSRTALYVVARFDTLLDPEKKIFPLAWLKRGIYKKRCWDSQGSGISIPDDVARQLEKDWAKFLKRPIPFIDIVFAEEAETARTYNEGAKKQITVNIYERNAEARAKCIQHYGTNCSVCGFNFEDMYGDIGKGFIHVHHLKPLSKIGRNYKLDPITDLRPICPNCHAMIHQRDPAYSINQLKAILKKKSKRR